MLSTLAVLLAFAPQGEVRGAGRVLDHAGAPVANATVTLLSRPIPRALDAGPEDRRVVRTDERGMFRVGLARAARYTAWASWATGATGLAEGVIGGEFLELRGSLGTRPVDLAFTGANAWSESKAFTLRAIVGGENIDFVPIEQDGDGWRLPSLPPKRQRTIEVLDARGEVLWAEAMGRTPGGRAQLALPPPYEHDVEVVDEDGKAIAGVDIRWHIRNYWYSESESLPYGDRFRSLWPVVATTDVEGRAKVRVARPEREKDLWLMACKDGYRLSLDGIDDGLRFTNGKVVAGNQEPTSGPIRITLSRSALVQVPLRVDATTPLAQRWLYLVCRVHVSRGNGATGTPINITLPVQNGIAQFLAPLPPGSDVEIAEIVLADARAASLQAKHGFRPRSVWRVPDPEKLVEDGGGGFDVEATRVLQVTAADGRPAARAVVLIEDVRSERKTMLRTDRLGRALLSAGRELNVGVLSDYGIGTVVVAADDEGVIALQLQELVALPLRVVDTAGEPAPGVSVRVSSVSGTAGEEIDLLWCARAMLSLRAAVASGNDGRLELLLPPVGCALRLNCDRRIDSGRDLDWDPKSTAAHELTVGASR